MNFLVTEGPEEPNLKNTRNFFNAVLIRVYETSMDFFHVRIHNGHR